MTATLEGKNILVVDDDPEMLTALETVLSDSGATIIKAVDGNEAIGAAVKDKPDLVVLDAMLPKRSGFLVLERLKSRKSGGDPPPVIMITGNNGKRHQSWAESLGVDDFIAKPFRMERLMQSAESLLGIGTA